MAVKCGQRKVKTVQKSFQPTDQKDSEARPLGLY